MSNQHHSSAADKKKTQPVHSPTKTQPVPLTTRQQDEKGQNIDLPTGKDKGGVPLGSQLTTQPDAKPTPSQDHHSKAVVDPENRPVAQLTREGQLAIPPSQVPSNEDKARFTGGTSGNRFVGQKANALSNLDEIWKAIQGFKDKEGYDVSSFEKKIEQLKSDMQSEDRAIVNGAIEEAINLTASESNFKVVSEVKTTKI